MAEHIVANDRTGVRFSYTADKFINTLLLLFLRKSSDIIKMDNIRDNIRRYNTDLDGVILYYGSLDELNSRNLNLQYKLAEMPLFISSVIPLADNTGSYERNPNNLVQLIKHIKKEIREAGFKGLVNYKTNISSNVSSHSFCGFGEGTPIYLKI